MIILILNSLFYLLVIHMKFKDISSEKLELWFNDVFIYQKESKLKSRTWCDVDNWLIDWVTLPIMSANMNAVSWKRMCETLSRYGWLWILPQDMSSTCKIRILSHVNQAHHEYDTPLLVSKNDTVWTALDLIDKKSHWCVCLFDWLKVIWYFKKEDLKKQDRFLTLDKIPSRSIRNCSFSEIILWKDQWEWKDFRFPKFRQLLDYEWIWSLPISCDWYEELYNFLDQNKEENAFIYEVDIKKESFKLLWILNKNDIIRRKFFHWTDEQKVRDRKRLQLWVAIWMNQMFEENIEEDIEMYFVNCWVQVFVVDTAHWYQEKMYEAVKKLRKILTDLEEEIPDHVFDIRRKRWWKTFHIIAWNVCTYEWAKYLFEAWSDWVKVWIWPWAMCTTRMMTWVWRPQFSSIIDCVKAANEYNWYIVADWWIKYTRDFCLALSAWAKFVMLWTMLSWTKESVWEVKYDEYWNIYKENFWMASSKAVLWRNQELNSYQIAYRDLFNEWISTSRIYLRDWMSTVWEVCEKLISWLKSSMTYTWSKNLEEYNENTEIWIQTSSWYQEWTPHWSIVK